MKNLTILNISQNNIGSDEGVYMITNSSCMSNVTELNLSEINITSACLIDLKKSKFLKKLRSLDLSYAFTCNESKCESFHILELIQCTLTEEGATT